ncbi:hypothetical protein BKA66DRAFT_569860 [Pyrenochaeta sp. MPI-SDFR-AT-0127]|nr:hypothetical protein BKA66DRAFT_569860 [Pyrenochaeta sp. MPI-SDFR-AT-0127]
MTSTAATGSEHVVGYNEIYEDIPQELPVHSYTNFVTDRMGLWYCPKCHWQTKSQRRWALQNRGYKKVPADYAHNVWKCYGPDYKNRLYFTNPAGVVQCQNYWDLGFSGGRCTFNREVIEGFRAPEDVEKLYDKHLGQLFGRCAQCSILTLDLRKDDERKSYIESLCGFDIMKKGLPPYIEYEESPWDGFRRYIRSFQYDGTEESLKCRTEKWGAGGSEEGKNTPCPGRYGGPVVFWVLDKAEVLKRKRELSNMVETGRLGEIQSIDGDVYQYDENNKQLEWREITWQPGEPWEEGANDSTDEGRDDDYYNEYASTSSDWSSYGQGEDVYSSS